jgi:hypothetical protein
VTAPPSLDPLPPVCLGLASLLPDPTLGIRSTTGCPCRPRAGKATQLPKLSEAQATKLKMLSVVTLSTKSKIISYDALMRELEISSVREVEDLLIRCIYGGLLEGKLDQQLKQLSVHTCAGRDIHPAEISAMLETLASWRAAAVHTRTPPPSAAAPLARSPRLAASGRSGPRASQLRLLGGRVSARVAPLRQRPPQPPPATAPRSRYRPPPPAPRRHDTSLAVLSALQTNMGAYKAQCEDARAQQAALSKKVDEAKATLRAQQDAGDAMRDDFEGGMDYDDDKTRKSGRAKLKHMGHGVGTRR